MIHYVKHTEIDKEQWDTCVSRSVNKLPYCLSDFLDITSPKWDALIADDYRTVMPLTWKKLFGLKYLVQPPLCQQLGIFSSNISSVNAENFIQAIPRKFIHARINFNYANTLSSLKYLISERINFELDISNTYNELFANFSNSHKKNIKRARNQAFTIREVNQIDLIVSLSRKCETDYFTIPPNYYRTLKQLSECSNLHFEFEIVLCYNTAGTPIAGILLLKSFNRIILLLTPSTGEGKKRRAIFGLFDYVLNKYAGSKLIFDFEGSNLPGVKEFFEGFGGTNTPYLYLQRGIRIR